MQPFIQGFKKNITAGLSIFTSVGLMIFWLLFFTVGLASPNAPDCYLVFEHAFPLPDILLSLVLLGAGILRWQARLPQLTQKLFLACGGALVFLGLLDFSFNFQNGMYLLSAVDLFTNAFINLWCVSFGLFLVLKTD